MSTTYNPRFQRKFMKEGMSVLAWIISIGVLFFLLMKMLYALDAENWPKATFWLIALIGISVERKLVAIVQVLEEIKWRRP